MVRYQVGCQQAQQRYIQFSAVFEQKATDTTLQLELPSWRPGRYELGNFAKNIKGFKAFGENKQPLPFQKTSKDTWVIESEGQTLIQISYSYCGRTQCRLYLPRPQTTLCQSGQLFFLRRTTYRTAVSIAITYSPAMANRFCPSI